jgi:hypothetical protein
MRWLKRGLWPVAWGVWAWLGVGLYRELPRNLGRPVCKLQVQGKQYPLGFLADSRRFATHTGASWKEPKDVSIWDAETGELLQKLATPPSHAKTSDVPEWVRIVKSSLVGFGNEDVMLALNAIDWVLDLDNGRIIDIGKCGRFVFHPTRPLAVFFNPELPAPLNRRKRSSPRPQELRLVDLVSGERRLTWPSAAAADGVKLVGKPLFLGDKRLAIPTKRRDGHRLEIWNLDALDAAPQIVEGPNLECESIGCSEHRIAWQTGSGENSQTHVFDLNLGREIFEAPSSASEKEMEVRTAGWEPMLRLDSSGCGLLNPNYSVLWDVDSGRVLWRGGYGLTQSAKDRKGWVGSYASAQIDCDTPDRFEAVETWYCKLGSWSGERNVSTVRSLRDGSVIYRCWRLTTTERAGSPNGRWMVDENWNVYELPPPANSMLLALCQSILALPLILLWLVLLWHRKRRERRLAGASA